MRCTIISEQDLLALRKPVSAALHRALSHYLGSPLHLQLLSSENRYSHNACVKIMNLQLLHRSQSLSKII